MMIYVCDHCGSVTSRNAVSADEEWTCARCGSHAAWEYEHTNRAHANEHAARISSGYRSGIFRRAI